MASEIGSSPTAKSCAIGEITSSRVSVSEVLAPRGLSWSSLAVMLVSPEGRQPLLVIPHGPRSAPVLQIADAASGLCKILWLIDETAFEDDLTSRLLRKVGVVVNIAGLSPEETASLLGPHAPDGAVAYRDQDIVPLSWIAEELRLDYHTPEVAWRLVDKSCQREALRKGGLPTPLCWEVPADRDPATVRALRSEEHTSEL